MAKPTIVTRAGKGSALTWTEGDANITNLKDATFTLEAGSGGTDVVSDLNGIITLVAGTNVTLSGDNTAKTVTINASGGGVTISDDTSTNATRYIVFEDATSGSVSTVNVASTKLTFNPSTGLLSATAFSGPINGTVGATTPATGTFTTMTAGVAVLDDIRETVAALTYGATITPNAADGSIRTITLTGNVTFSEFTTPVSGQTITLIITQDATGSRTLTSTMKFSGGSKTLSTAANAVDILTVSYIGTTYYASLAKAFA